jgi:hypothetical protein
MLNSDWAFGLISINVAIIGMPRYRVDEVRNRSRARRRSRKETLELLHNGRGCEGTPVTVSIHLCIDTALESMTRLVYDYRQMTKYLITGSCSA